MQVRSPGQEDPLEKGMATHSSILAWRIPWTEEPGRLQPMGSQRVRQDWETEHIWARCNMKLVSSEIFRHLYLSNLRWVLAQILSLPCCVWFRMTPENCLWHPTPRMIPFSISCHASVLLTSSCQMGIIMNAFIANVIKPNITSVQD